MLILGINAYHGDSSAALVRDGHLVAAVEEERFRRIKHWAGFPSESIAYCLESAGADLRAVDHVALNSDPSVNMLRRLGHVLFSRPDIDFIVDRLRNRKKRASVETELDRLSGASFRGVIHRIEHHISHLESCFTVSPFEQAAVVSIDGFGDFSSAAWGVGLGSRIEIFDRVYFPHSLGIFYQALTQFLGFPHYGDEYKVMGLGPYGQPRYMDEMRRIVRLHPEGGFELDLRYFRHHREHVPYQWSDGSPHVGDLFSTALEDLLGPRRDSNAPLEQRHRDLACSVQAMYEEAFFNLLRVLQKKTGLVDLAIAGGCGMNSVANGRVRRQTPFQKIYVQSAAGDAGGAIGAAYSVWNKLGGKRGFVMDHAYWGPDYGDDEVSDLVRAEAARIAAAGCIVESYTDDSELCKRTATIVAEGKVVGWFQGRLEWGPRALGNRSIVCDPRRADMKEILNAKIKRRESFRPFAPSVLDRAVADWFEEADEVPFMMQVFQFREQKRPLVPAVCHVDGSGRLQTVRRETNPRYFELIEQFEAITGIPMVLNTSFNENEPVVCRPSEALDCFLRTEMDLLVLGNTTVARPKSS